MSEKRQSGGKPDIEVKLTPAEIEAEANLAMAWEDLPATIQERMILVRDFTRKGIAQSMIAAFAKVSERTVQRDLQRWKTLHRLKVEQFQPDERIGQSASFYEEVRDKLVTAADEVLSEEKKTADQYSTAARLFHEAMVAESKINELMKDTGLLKTAPKRILIGGHLDISKLGPQELEQAIVDLDRHLQDREARIARLQSPSPFEDENS